MSDQRYLEAAVVAISAISKPDSADQMLDIYRSSNDPDWKQAAVRALGPAGAAAKRYERGSIILTRTWRSPTVEDESSAAIAPAESDSEIVLGIEVRKNRNCTVQRHYSKRKIKHVLA